MGTKSSLIFEPEDQINENLNSHMSRLDVLYSMKQGFTAKDREIFGDDQIFESLKEANKIFKSPGISVTTSMEYHQTPLTEEQRNDLINGTNFREYIISELLQGKYEFRVAIQNDKHIIIHPMGKDGQILDLYL